MGEPGWFIHFVGSVWKGKWKL